MSQRYGTRRHLNPPPCCHGASSWPWLKWTKILIIPSRRLIAALFSLSSCEIAEGLTAEQLHRSLSFHLLFSSSGSTEGIALPAAFSGPDSWRLSDAGMRATHRRDACYRFACRPRTSSAHNVAVVLQILPGFRLPYTTLNCGPKWYHRSVLSAAGALAVSSASFTARSDDAKLSKRKQPTNAA